MFYKNTTQTKDTIFSLPEDKQITDYFYEDKGQLRFADAKFKNDIKVNTTYLKKFKNDYMVFSEGKWEQITSESVLKMLKKYILEANKKLLYSDSQFKRVLDVIEASVYEFASANEIHSIQTTYSHKVISQDHLYHIIKNKDNGITISKESNKGQYYNFVSLPPLDIDTKEIVKNIDKYLTSNSIIDKFLQDITLQDISMIKYLQELVGYSMLFGNLEPRIYIGLGSGSNGKSVFASMLKYILGVDNVSSLEFSDINAQTSPIMERSFLNLPTELSANKLLPENILKAISDGESIMANEKYMAPRDIMCKAKLFALCNTLPVISDATDGFWRRATVVPFDLKIDKSTKSKQDKNHFNVVFKENIQLLREWGFIGLLRLIKNNGNHTECKRIHSASRLYMINNNNALMFLEEFINTHIINRFNIDKIYQKETLEIGNNSYNTLKYYISGNGEHSISLKQLFTLYKEWTSDNGYKTLSIKNFRHKLEEKQDSNTFEFSYDIRRTNEYKIFFDENDFIAINKKANILHEAKPIKAPEYIPGLDD